MITVWECELREPGQLANRLDLNRRLYNDEEKPVPTTTHELAPLITELRGLIHSVRHAVATTVNTLQVLTNFEIGRRIVEHEQLGTERAEYGKELLKELSERLNEEFGRGFSEDNLRCICLPRNCCSRS